MSQDFLDIQYLSDSGVESTEDDDEEHEFTTWQIFRPTSLQFYKNNHHTEIQPCNFRKCNYIAKEVTRTRETLYSKTRVLRRIPLRQNGFSRNEF